MFMRNIDERSVRNGSCTMEKVECYDVDVAGDQADGSQRRMQFCRLSLQRCLSDDGAPQHRSLTVDLYVDVAAAEFVVEWSVFKKMRSWSPGERFQVPPRYPPPSVCAPCLRVDESVDTSEDAHSLGLPPIASSALLWREACFQRWR
jgi:hypothetical protein